jgi:hypothetical protein
MIDPVLLSLDLAGIVIVGFVLQRDWQRYQEDGHYISRTKPLNVAILITGCVLLFAFFLELAWHLSGGQTTLKGNLILSFLWLGLTIYRERSFFN